MQLFMHSMSYLHTILHAPHQPAGFFLLDTSAFCIAMLP